jgi:hypothetical protein
MNNTVMPMVKEQLIELKKSSIVTVYHIKQPSNVFRSYTVPKSIRRNTIAFLQEPVANSEEKKSVMTFAYEDPTHPGLETFGAIHIDDDIFQGVPFFELSARIVISCFNELFIGDLAFLAMLIGMNNSSGAHCLICMLKKSEFNCEHTQLTPRTKQSLAHCLEEYMVLVNNPTRKAPPNYKGVNGQGLWDIDPQRIVIPILHCPMGLVDKILESMKAWVNFDVEDYHDNDTEATRSVYKIAKQQHEAAVASWRQAQELLATNPFHPQAKTLEQEANKARLKAKKAESQAKVEYDDQVQKHNARKTSLNQQFEVIYRANGIKREHYHGGKFNGVNCIRIMSKSNYIFLGNNAGTEGIINKCLQSKTTSISEDTVREGCMKYCRLLTLLDAVWSSVRGIDAGLLPTHEQIESLSNALQEAKSLWISMGLSTLQPKWHLTFDGHLLHQVQKYGGLADKSDESIEKGHQTLKTLRERFRGISSYQQRESCIRRELRRGRSPEIQQHIDDYEALIKQSQSSKRAIDTTERQESVKKAKQERRGATDTSI